MNELVSITISDLKLMLNRISISWSYGLQTITKRYQFPVLSANVLRDGRGVAVVESMSESAPRNAVVFNGDGTERFRVMSPLSEDQVQGFSDFYYVGSELTAILTCPGRDFAVVVDELSGKCMRFYETR
jgi:hypothetical protein